MTRKRGQASMEYLLNYSWAILMIIAVLVIIIYLRIFEIGNRIPERCEFKVGVLCKNSRITDHSVTFILKNGLGAKMSICNVVCDDSKTASDIKLGGSDGQCTEEPLAVLDVGQAEWPIGPVDGGCRDKGGTITPLGERYKGKAFITYYLDRDAGSPRIVEGYLEAVVQP